MRKNKVDIQVAKHLYLTRKKLNKTVEQMAEVMGVRFQQYCKYENGVDRMKCSHLLTIAKHFALDLNKFMEDPNQFIDLTIHEQNKVNAKFARIERELNNESVVSSN